MSYKRFPNIVVSVTQSATPTIDTDTGDIFTITGLAQAITSFTTNLTGSPLPGEIMMIQITDNGTARAITWGSSFESASVTLPTTTVLSTLLRVLFQWNQTANKWDCISSDGSSTSVNYSLFAGWIEGLNPTWVSASTLGVSAGSCYIESLATVVYGAPSNIVPSSPSNNTWYHIYAYSNSGTLTLEASTTVPVAFATPFGTAKSKTGDTSRRYVYSARTDGSGNFRQFVFNGTQGTYTWNNTTPNSTPFRVLSNGAAIVSTSIDCSAVVAPTAVTLFGDFIVVTGGASAAYFSSGNFTASVSGFNVAIGAGQVQYGNCPCSSTQTLNYIATASAGVYLDIYGFILDR